MAKQINLGKVKGENATINGVNALTIEGGSNITATQSGSVLTINTSLPSTTDTLTNDNKLPTGIAVSAALNAKQDKVAGASGDIAVVASGGSGLTTSNTTIATTVTDSDGSVPTSKAVNTAITNAISTKQDKITGTAGKIAVVATSGTGIEASGVTISSSLTDSDTTVPTGAAVKAAINAIPAGGGSGASITVDDALNASSSNPVQNSVISSNINSINSSISTINGSINSINNNISSMNTEINGKMNKVAGTSGQVIGFDASGNPVAQAAPTGSGTITIDSSLSSTSTNAVQNKVVKAALDQKQDSLTVDASLSSSSTNPIQNKAVKSAIDTINATLNTKQDSLTFETTLTNSSTKVPRSSAVYTAIQNASTGGSVTVDSSLSSSSTNPVQNKVINTALSNKLDKPSNLTYNNRDQIIVANSNGDGVTVSNYEIDDTDTAAMFPASSAGSHWIPTAKSVARGVEDGLQSKFSKLGSSSSDKLLASDGAYGIKPSGYDIKTTLNNTTGEIPTSTAVWSALSGKQDKYILDIAICRVNWTTDAADWTHTPKIVSGDTSEKSYYQLATVTPEYHNQNYTASTAYKDWIIPLILPKINDNMTNLTVNNIHISGFGAGSSDINWPPTSVYVSASSLPVNTGYSNYVNVAFVLLNNQLFSSI